MNTCRQVARLLPEFVSSHLGPDLCETIHAHLRVCPDCAADVASYRRVIRLTRLLPPAPLPPALAERVRALLAGTRFPGCPSGSLPAPS